MNPTMPLWAGLVLIVVVGMMGFFFGTLFGGWFNSLRDDDYDADHDEED